MQARIFEILIIAILVCFPVVVKADANDFHCICWNAQGEADSCIEHRKGARGFGGDICPQGCVKGDGTCPPYFSPDLPPPTPTHPATGKVENENCKMENGQEVCYLENPLSGDITDVPTLIGTIIKAALGIVGALSLYMFIIGGFIWLTSAGNPEKVKRGAKTMLWAAIGVLITFISYLALSTLLKYT